MKKSSFWPWATVAVAAASVIYTSMSSSRARREGRQQKPGQEYNVPPEYERVFERNPLVPAGWSFGIAWSTIYTGLAGLVIHQALASQQDNPRYAGARPWLWLNFGLNAIFGRYFSDNDPRSVIISDVVTKLNLPASLALHQQLEIGKTTVSGPEEYLRIPVSLYSGWLTVASVIGTPDSLLTLGWNRNARRDEPLSVGLVGATGALGYVVARQLNDPWYMVPFVIGLGGIATRQSGRRDDLAVVAGTLAAGYVALLAYWLPKKNFRPLQPATVEDTVAAIETVRPAGPESAPYVPESLVELD